jgi:hypothetical protein
MKGPPRITNVRLSMISHSRTKPVGMRHQSRAHLLLTRSTKSAVYALNVSQALIPATANCHRLHALTSAEANVGHTLGKMRGGPTDHSFRRGPSAYRGNEPADHIGGSRAPPERGADRRWAPVRSRGPSGQFGC